MNTSGDILAPSSSVLPLPLDFTTFHISQLVQKDLEGPLIVNDCNRLI